MFIEGTGLKVSHCNQLHNVCVCFQVDAAGSSQVKLN